MHVKTIAYFSQVEDNRPDFIQVCCLLKYQIEFRLDFWVCIADLLFFIL